MSDAEVWREVRRYYLWCLLWCVIVFALLVPIGIARAMLDGVMVMPGAAFVALHRAAVVANDGEVPTL